MAYFKCRCGAVIALKTGAEPYRAMLVDQRFFIEGVQRIFAEFEGAEAKPPFITKRDAELNLLTAEFYRHARDAIFCEACGRLWLKKAADDTFEAYVKEDEIGKEAP